MSSFANVQHMVLHLYNECKTFYAPTKHKDSWVFYHDALKLMTAGVTIEWMKTKGIYKDWLKPELGICDAFGMHSSHCVGNQVHQMSLDNSCNKDVTESNNHHVALSKTLW